MIWLILISGFLLRLLSLNQSFWLDEAINVMAVKTFSLSGLLTQYIVADFHPPGWLVILWVWGKLFGFTETAARMPSVIFGTLTIFIVYLIGKNLISKKLGIVAALLLSINPLHIYYSQEARMYALAALAVAVNMLLVIKIIKGEKINLIFLIISNLGILISDYVAYFIFPAQFIFLLFLRKKEIFKKWLIALIGASIFFLIWLPFFLRQLDTGVIASSILPAWKLVVGGFDLKTIPLTFIKFIIGRISLADKTLYALVLMPVVSLFAFLLLKGIKSLDKVQKNLLVSWMITPVIIATIISRFVPVYSYFRVLYIIPGFALLTAVGILSLKEKLSNIFLVTVVLIQIICSFIYLLNPQFQREDWKGLVSYLRSINPPVILLESSGTFPPFDYYDGGRLNVRPALKDFPAKDESEVADLEEITDKREVYLIDYLVQISDPKRLVAKKLSDLGYREKETLDFHGVGFVYRYVKD